MAEYGAGAYEILTSSRQSDRLFDVDLDSGLGRKPSAVPAHLSRVLYVPKHSMLNVSLYDAQVQYQKAINTSPLGNEHLVGRALIGSRLFKTRLNTMDRATVIQNSAPQYVVDLDVERIRDGGDISATLRARAPTDDGKIPEINIILPMLTDVFSVTAANTGDRSQHIDISTTYPIQQLRTNAGVIQFPYFAFSLDDGSIRYEWQIHPLDHGTLRYTLLRLRSTALPEAPPRQHENAHIVAIYHHIGHDGSLFLPTSEGVLLLPALEKDTSPLLEMVTVASLVGLLWRVRGMEIREAESVNETQKRRSLLQRIFGARK